MIWIYGRYCTTATGKGMEELKKINQLEKEENERKEMKA